MEERYGRSAKIFTTVILVLAVTAIFGAQIIAMGIIFNLVGNPLGISYNAAIVIVGIILVLYTFTGGLIAVVYTDLIQLIIILVMFLFVLLFFFFSFGYILTECIQLVYLIFSYVWTVISVS